MQDSTLRILVIDDNPGDARRVEELLAISAAGSIGLVYTLQRVERLDQALYVLAEQPVDAILVDLFLPDSLGLDTIRRLLGRFPELPVIVMSSLDDQDLGLQAVQTGAQDYLVKNQIDEFSLARAIHYAIERKRAYLALQEREVQLREAQELGRIGNWLFDLQSQAITWSEQVYELYERDSSLGPPTSEDETVYYSPEQTRLLGEYARRAIENQEQLEFDLVVNLPSGRKAYFAATIKPEIGVQGSVTHLVGTVQDITERKKMEIALRDEKMLIDAMINTFPDSIYFKDRQSRITRLNHAMLQNLSLTDPHQAIGKTDTDLFGSEMGIRTFTQEQRLMETGEPIIGLVESWQREDARINWTSTTKVPLSDTDGEVVGLVGITREINDLKESEQALQESEERYRDLIENSQELICTHDLKGYLRMANPAAIKALGYSQDQVVGLNVRDFLAPETRDQFDQYLVVLKTIGQANGLMRVRTNTGEIRIWEYNNTLRTEGVAEPIVRGMARDVTDRVRAEQALRRSENKLRAIFNAMSDTIVVYDSQGFCREIGPTNPAGPHPPQTEMLGKHVDELFPKQVANLIVDCIQETLRSGQIVECEYALPLNGEDTWFSANASTLEDDMVIWVSRDITERKKTEQALREGEARYRAIVEDQTEMVCRSTPEGVLTFVNGAYCRTYGKTADRLIGYNWLDFYPPDEREIVRQRVNTLSPENPSISFEYQVQLPDGRLRWQEWTDRALLNDRGLVEEIQSVGRDITKRKQAEEALRHHAGEMAALHEISQAINAIKDVHQVYSQLSEKLARLVGAEMCAVALLDPIRDEIVAQTPGFGISDQILAQLHYPRELGQGTWDLAEHGAFLANSPESIPAYFQRMTQLLGIQSVLMLPLQTNGRFGGVIFAANKPQGFDEDDIHMMKTLVNQAGVVLEKAGLFDEAQRHLSELTLLQAVSTAAIDLSDEDELILEFTRIVSSSMYNTHFGVLMVDDAAGLLRVHPSYQGIPAETMDDTIPYGEGITGHTWQTANPTRIADVLQEPQYRASTPGIRSELCVPLIIGQRVIGVVNAESARPGAFNQDDERLLTTLAGQLATTIANIRLFKDTLHAAERLAILHQVSQQIATNVYDIEQVYTAIHQATARMMPCDAFAITLLTDDRKHLEFVYLVDNDQRYPIHDVPLEGTLSYRIVQSGQAMLVADLAARDDLKDIHYGDSHQVRSILAVPLWHGEVVIGMLSAQAYPALAFSQEDQHLLEMLAANAASAIQNARLLAQTQRRLNELEMINRVSTALRTAETLDEMLPIFLEETLVVLQTTTGSLALYDQSSDAFQLQVSRGWFERITTTPPRGYGIAGQVMASGQMYTSEDFAHDPLTSEDARHLVPDNWGGACLPVRSGQEIIGLLYIAIERPRQLQTVELNFLVTLTEMIGNAIQRAQLHEKAELQVSRLTALRSIDQVINGSLDLKLTLEMLLDQVTTQLEVDAANVLLLDPNAHLLEVIASQGFRSKVNRKRFLRLGDSQAGKAVLQRRRVAIPRVDTQPGTLFQAGLLDGEDLVSYHAVPLIAKGIVNGVLEVFHRREFHPEVEWVSFLETMAGQAALAIDNANLFQGLQHSNQELALAYDRTLEGWAHALELRDNETEGHARRVTEMTLALARSFGLRGEALVHIRRGALLHDIGKMGIPDNILHKPGPLDEAEWALMHQHPVFAYDMLKSIDFLRPALDIPYAHHEKWDGSGYPQGLAGEQIPLAARLFAIVDVWDALNSDRPYRPAWPPEKVIAYIQECSSTQFDPDVVEAFLKMLEQPY